MPHVYRSFYLHLVFHVNRCNILPEDIAPMHAYMQGVLTGAGCSNITVGGIEDHVHILAEFPVDKVGKTVATVKATATAWLKRRNPSVYQSFTWQGGSGQFTVSYSITSKVRQYIKNQRKHHQKITAMGELSRLIELHGINPHAESDISTD